MTIAFNGKFVFKNNVLKDESNELFDRVRHHYYHSGQFRWFPGPDIRSATEWCSCKPKDDRRIALDFLQAMGVDHKSFKRKPMDEIKAELAKHDIDYSA